MAANAGGALEQAGTWGECLKCQLRTTFVLLSRSAAFFSRIGGSAAFECGGDFGRKLRRPIVSFIALVLRRWAERDKNKNKPPIRRSPDMEVRSLIGT